jgi:hypothetical protein
MSFGLFCLTLLALLCGIGTSEKILGNGLDDSFNHSLKKVYHQRAVKTRLKIPAVESAGYLAYRQQAIAFSEPGKDEGKDSSILLFPLE